MPDPPFSEAGRTGKHVTTFSHQGLSPSTAYCYRVRALGPANNPGPYSSVVCAATPGAPSNPALRPNPSAPNQASAQFANLIAWWPLYITNPSANAVDLVNGLTGAPTGIQTASDPLFGQVFKGDGTTRKYRVPYSSLIDFGGTQASDPSLPYTATAWVKITIDATSLSNANNPPNMYLYTFDNPSPAFPGHSLGFCRRFDDSNNDIVTEVDIDSNAAQVSNYGNKKVNDGRWHHVAAVYNCPGGANQNTSGIIGFIYVDGVLDVQSTGSTQLLKYMGIGSPGASQPLYIGTEDDGTTLGFQGQFCDLRIYGSALSQSLIRQMQAGTSTQWELYS